MLSPGAENSISWNTPGAIREESNGHQRVLVGPEGGFSPDERNMLLSSDNIKSVHLGKRILRAETAAIAVLSVVKLS